MNSRVLLPAASLVLCICSCSDSASSPAVVADTSVDSSTADAKFDVGGHDTGGADADAAPDASDTPIEIGDASATLRWQPSSSILTLSRGGEALLRWGPDAFQLGVGDVDPDVNYDPYGLFHDLTVPAAPPIDGWVTPTQAQFSETSQGLRGELTYEGDIRVEVTFAHAAPGRFDARLVPITGAERIAIFRLSPQIDAAEGLYGLGEVFDDVNHRGHVRAMQLEVQLGIESVNNEAHVPIPLLIGTRGWGLFVHSFHPAVFDVASKVDDRIDAAFALAQDSADGLAFHLLAEPHPLDVTRHYYELTGFPIIPARWALGPWIWRDENEDQAQVENDVQTIRDLDLATTGYWIDRPYATGVNTFDFAADMFPDADAMISRMHDLGFRVALWHTPYLDPADDATAALRAEAVDFFPTEAATALGPWGPLMDLTNPAAMAWWQTNLRQYTDRGIEGFKLDYAEEVLVGIAPQRARWSFDNGRDERTMHALYQQYYHQAYADLLPASGGFLLCRGGTIGDQTRVSVIWPGDLDANMARHGTDLTDRNGETYRAVGGLPAALVAGLSLGPSGYPLYGSDTGGYRHAPPDKETFVRWFQTTSVSTVMQVGTNSNDVAWEFDAENGFDQESLDLYRTYARLHLRLFPYLWTYLERLQTDGRPIQRALGLAYPELGVHPNDQFMLGDVLYAAPVVERGARTRTMTMPPGVWFDWWTGVGHTGGATVTVDAPLDTLPLYLSGNGIVPLLRPTIDTMSPVADPGAVDSYATTPGRIHARVAVGADATFELFDGARLTATPGADWSVTSSDGAEFAQGVVWEVMGRAADAPAPLLDGAELAQAADIAQVDRGWSFDGVITYIAVPAGNHTVVVPQ